ncbi:hypothetical protein FOA52_010506 [Chlamydomonas sp. UWO 241]|nr:hypothetical protein FOA52_010506 [Chlamydomonas sp. UWO 241]
MGCAFSAPAENSTNERREGQQARKTGCSVQVVQPAGGRGGHTSTGASGEGRSQHARTSSGFAYDASGHGATAGRTHPPSHRSSAISIASVGVDVGVSALRAGERSSRHTGGGGDGSSAQVDMSASQIVIDGPGSMHHAGSSGSLATMATPPSFTGGRVLVVNPALNGSKAPSSPGPSNSRPNSGFAGGQRYGAQPRRGTGDQLAGEQLSGSSHPSGGNTKLRRAGAGSEAVRSEIHRLVGNTSDGPKKEHLLSDSEDETESARFRPSMEDDKPPEVRAAISKALGDSFLFRGIPDAVLAEVVNLMSGVCFCVGAQVLQQDAMPGTRDCMYVLTGGEAEVVISGTVDETRVRNTAGGSGQDRSSDKQAGEIPANTRQVRITKYPGWVFGEVALLFNSVRSASVVAKTNITVFALSRAHFLRFIMQHAPGARALRFLRKVPLLKGLSDNDLIRAAARMPQRTYQDGENLIRYGERGEELYMIRYGKVKVMRPDSSGPPALAALLGRGQFVGERAVINNRLRSADCVAEGMVKVVVMKKSDFMDLDNPMLAWMMDYDVLSAALRFMPRFKDIKQELLEQMLDLFDERSEVAQGRHVLSKGDDIDRLHVVKLGEVALMIDGQPAPADESFLREVGGIYVFGEAALTCNFPSPYDVVATSESAHVLMLRKSVLDNFLGCGGDKSMQTSQGAMVPTASSAAIVDDELSFESTAWSSRIFKMLDPRAMLGRTSVDGTGGSNTPRSRHPVHFKDLKLHRIVGTGQFGLVRLVSDTQSTGVYALKVMHKAPIVEGKQIEHITNERRILGLASESPFCVKLVAAYQDARSLYLLQEWVPGGELFHHLDVEGSFNEHTAVFYAANVVLAFEFLHGQGVIYRDLKPENLLLDARGYLKMADFGFAKAIGDGKTYTICGTPDYQAPEVILKRGATKAVDYWGLGVLIFEMLVGDPPFKSLTGDPWDTFRRALSGRFFVPNFISDTASDVIFKLLQVNPDKRLGSGPAGIEDIKSHPFFASVDWKTLATKKGKAPFKPKVRNPLDTSNFDNFQGVDELAPKLGAAAIEKQPPWDEWEWVDDDVLVSMENRW